MWHDLNSRPAPPLLCATHAPQALQTKSGEIERLLARLGDVNDSMRSALSGTADARSHTLARHRDILHDFAQAGPWVGQKCTRGGGALLLPPANRPIAPAMEHLGWRRRPPCLPRSRGPRCSAPLSAPQEFRRLGSIMGAARDRADLLGGSGGLAGGGGPAGASSQGLLLRERGLLAGANAAMDEVMGTASAVSTGLGQQRQVSAVASQGGGAGAAPLPLAAPSLLLLAGTLGSALPAIHYADPGGCGQQADGGGRQIPRSEQVRGGASVAAAAGYRRHGALQAAVGHSMPTPCCPLRPSTSHRSLMNAIRRRKNRDSLILAAVAAACTLALLLYWANK